MTLFSFLLTFSVICRNPIVSLIIQTTQTQKHLCNTHLSFTADFRLQFTIQIQDVDATLVPE